MPVGMPGSPYGNNIINNSSFDLLRRVSRPVLDTKKSPNKNNIKYDKVAEDKKWKKIEKGAKQYDRELPSYLAAAKATEESKYANSPFGLAVNTIKGIPEAAVKMLPHFKKGGTVKKTGPAIVHKGEMVVPRKAAKQMTLAQIKKSIQKTKGY